MNFAKIQNQYIVIELTDSDKSGHDELLEKIYIYLKDGIKEFILDLTDVKTLTSNIVGLVIGISRSFEANCGKLYLCGLSSHNRDVFETTVGLKESPYRPCAMPIYELSYYKYKGATNEIY